MIESKKIDLHKDWKIVKEIELDKKLEEELENILSRRMMSSNDKEGAYRTKRKSIIRKNRKK